MEKLKPQKIRQNFGENHSFLLTQEIFIYLDLKSVYLLFIETALSTHHGGLVVILLALASSLPGLQV